MPGAPPSQQSHSSSSEQLQIIQALSDCCCVVLRLAADAEQQAKLLVDCVGRAVTGRIEQAVPVLQLLRMLLRQVGPPDEVAADRAAVSEQLHQVRWIRWWQGDAGRHSAQLLPTTVVALLLLLPVTGTHGGAGGHQLTCHFFAAPALLGLLQLEAPAPAAELLQCNTVACAALELSAGRAEWR
jgi:hypothetical protein